MKNMNKIHMHTIKIQEKPVVKIVNYIKTINKNNITITLKQIHIEVKQ